jgi:hypothetical protein
MPSKSLELSYLNRALDLMGIVPDGPIKCDETPDFLVLVAGETIGIEVTSFYFPEPDASQPHQARIGMQRISVEQARREFRSQGGPALYVTVRFVPDRCLSKRRAYELGPLLARALAATAVPISIHEPPIEVDIELLPPEVASISVYGSVDATDELWYPAIAGWVAPIERDHIEADIARKAEKLPTIRRKCAIAWLLIVNDGFRGGAMCELSRDLGPLPFNSPFDRTLWLDSPGVYDLSPPTVRIATKPSVIPS